ncbi:MAG: alpha/beta hydrolase [Luminiphilus sp.]|nr:alpha/beta hydrolase [Luminiphilus sp.]
MYHGEADRPLIVYFHGGGWVIGNLDTHDPFCRSLADASKSTIMSIDYRLAPEHVFPAAHDDCLSATDWILANLNTLAPNNGKVVLAGDSAGGNLTACTAATLINEPRLVGTIMIYPATEHYLKGFPSFREHAKSKPLTAPIMRWFIDTYLGDTAPAATEAKTVFVNRRTDYKGFPRSLVVTAERDVLRDDGKRLGITLRQAGVDTTYHHYANEAHGFACSEGPTEGHQHFIALATEWLAPLRSNH